MTITDGRIGPTPEIDPGTPTISSWPDRPSSASDDDRVVYDPDNGGTFLLEYNGSSGVWECVSSGGGWTEVPLTKDGLFNSDLVTVDSSSGVSPSVSSGSLVLGTLSGDSDEWLASLPFECRGHLDVRILCDHGGSSVPSAGGAIVGVGAGQLPRQSAGWTVSDFWEGDTIFWETLDYGTSGGSSNPDTSNSTAETASDNLTLQMIQQEERLNNNTELGNRWHGGIESGGSTHFAGPNTLNDAPTDFMRLRFGVWTIDGGGYSSSGSNFSGSVDPRIHKLELRL